MDLGSFVATVGLLLAFDLGVLHRKSHAIGVRESLALSAFYIAIGLGFGGVIYWWMGGQAASEYLTGFVVEKSLAMDNIFVIAMIFSYFAIPAAYQHRVLVYGILGVADPSRHPDRGRGGDRHRVLMGALSLRRLSGPDRHQDVVHGRKKHDVSKSPPCSS